MKTFNKSLLTLLVCSFLFSVNSFSKERTNVIKANPLGLAFGNFNATYEKVLNSKSSVLFSGNYMFKLLGADVSVGGLGVGYRYYFTHAKTEVPTGFWVMPQARFAFGSLKDKQGVKESITTFSVGAEVGYQWAWSNGFTLDLGIGPNYTMVNGNKTNLETTSRILPSLTLAIGYAF